MGLKDALSALLSPKKIRVISIGVLIYLLATFSHRASAAVVINELYYDHVGNDDGWEFVELYNNSDSSIDISRWRLKFIDGRTCKEYLLWEAFDNLIIEAHGYLLLCGERYSSDERFRLRRSIENGPDAVMLESPSGKEDIVGFGDLENPSLFESAPAYDAEAGYSIARKPDGMDTDNNREDFVIANATPGRKNFFNHDLAISLQQELIACSGKSLLLDVCYRNCGLLDFASSISINVSMLDSYGNIIDSRTREVEADLRPGDYKSAAFSLQVPSTLKDDSLSIEANITSSLDEDFMNDSDRATASILPGRIIVNEIMYRPEAGDCEWVELYNRSSSSVNIKDWSIADKTGSRKEIADGDLLIEPGGYLILCQDSLLFSRKHPLCACEIIEPIGGWPRLNDFSNDTYADVIKLYNERGRVVELVRYREVLLDERGRSIERVSSELCPLTDAGIWERCLAPELSTAGRKNSVSSEIIPKPGDALIAPNPFNPLREKLRISATCQREAKAIKVLIYDLDGIVVARLFSDFCNGNTYSCFWDGRTRGGEMAHEGLYICVVEFIDPGGGVFCVVKRGVVLSMN